MKITPALILFISFMLFYGGATIYAVSTLTLLNLSGGLVVLSLISYDMMWKYANDADREIQINKKEDWGLKEI